MAGLSESDELRMKQGTTPPSSTTASVDFSSHSEVFPVPHLSDMADVEVSARWMSRRDLEFLQLDAVSTARAMRQGRLDPRTMTPRGLEHLRSAGHLEQRKINKDCVSHAVLGAQRRGRAIGDGEDSGEDIAEELRAASERASLWAREYALALGKEDAAFVEAERKALRMALRDSVKGTTPMANKASENSAKERCLAVLESAMVLTEGNASLGADDALRGGGPCPSTGSGSPPETVQGRNELETKSQNVSVHPPSCAFDNNGENPNTAPQTSSKKGFFAKFRGLNNELVPEAGAASSSSLPLQQRGGAEGKGGELDGHPNMAVDSLRTVAGRALAPPLEATKKVMPSHPGERREDKVGRQG